MPFLIGAIAALLMMYLLTKLGQDTESWCARVNDAFDDETRID